MYDSESRSERSRKNWNKKKFRKPAEFDEIRPSKRRGKHRRSRWDEEWLEDEDFVDRY